MSVELRSVSVFYRRGSVSALSEVSFELGGGLTSLVGPNGSGKTTVLRILTLLHRRYRGEMLLNGEAVKKRGSGVRTLQRQIGYLPQGFQFANSWTVKEFVSYCAWLKCVPSSQLVNAVTEALERVRLSELSSRKMGALSGGMLRRAGLAQAIVHKPELLLLDEPAAGLDPEQRIVLRELITELAREKTVLTSTHLIDEAIDYSDRIILLANGKLKFHDSAGEFQNLARSFTEHNQLSRIEQAYLALQK